MWSQRRIPSSADEESQEDHFTAPSSIEPRRTVPYASLSYANKRTVSVQQKGGTNRGLIFLVTNRGRLPWNYLMLRMSKWHFWGAIVSWLAALVAASWLGFVAAGEAPADALELALAANSLNVGDPECADWPCRLVGALARTANLVYELFVAAVVVVRVMRAVAKRRFLFSDFAVLDDTELKLRIVSNRPSTLIQPTFVVEWFDKRRQVRPLQLTNAGAVAYLNDGVFYVRHKLDAASPFADPDWRATVYGIRVAVVGFDDVLASETSGCRFYLARDIRDDLDFSDIIQFSRVQLGPRATASAPALVVDAAKINDSVPRQAPRASPVDPAPTPTPPARPSLAADDDSV